MFYQSRWYDPSLGRMAQADTIVPGGVQGLDRYAYVNNSPLNYVDPSGHKACWATTQYSCNLTENDIDKLLQSDDGDILEFLNNILKKTNTTILFACGVGTGATCEDEDGMQAYGGHRPFYLHAYGLSNIAYIGYQSGEGPENYAIRIKNFITSTENEDKNFILVGHSVGADAILRATKLIHESEGLSRVKGVMLFDPGASNIFRNSYINELVQNNIPVAIFASSSYWGLAHPKRPHGPRHPIEFASITLPSSTVVVPGVVSHFDLVVHPNTYLETGPILYHWILGLQ